MSISARLSSYVLWIVAPIIALAFLLWIDAARVRRVELITSLGGASAAIDPESPTGYANGVRMLIVPAHNNESYQSIAQTQLMIAGGDWRLRHVDYDNAPLGREVLSPSPYRWWLAAVAWGEHVLSGRPIGLAVERAALWADPILHILLLVGTAVFVRWRFGTLPAILVSIGVMMLFPLAGSFIPGSPDSRNLAHIALFASVLILAAGVFTIESGNTRAGRWFFAAGLVAGGALWLGVSAVPILIGVGLGGLVAAWLGRRDNDTEPLPWRNWGVGGAVGTLAAFLMEYAPAQMDLGAWRLTEVQPLYALAWLGGGEALTRIAEWMRSGRPGRRGLVTLGAASLALLSVPAVMLFKHDAGFLNAHALANVLTSLDGGTEAGDAAEWMSRDFPTLRLIAACLPLAILGVALWLAWRRNTQPLRRAALIIVLGPAIVALGLACVRLSWWNQLDFMLLVLLVVASTGAASIQTLNLRAGVWIAGTIAIFCPGIVALLPPALDSDKPVLTWVELDGLIERDFAHWLARRVGPGEGIVLAPPNLTVSLMFHGGLRGLGSPYRENTAGFRAATRIAGATSADEAQALVQQRRLTHIVIPSWDGFLDEYARLGANQPENSLMGLLHKWLPPRWLRPVAYRMPQVAGFEDQSVVVFEVVDLQDNAVALSRLAEYFVEVGELNLAAASGEALGRLFPDDLGATVARMETAISTGDQEGARAAFDVLEAQLASGTPQALPWDRRVSLAIVLGTAKRFDQARTQLEQCLGEIDDTRLRTLTTDSLYRFLTLTKALGLKIEDPQLAELASQLLPPEMRAAE